LERDADALGDKMMKNTTYEDLSNALKLPLGSTGFSLEKEPFIQSDETFEFVLTHDDWPKHRKLYVYGHVDQTDNTIRYCQLGVKETYITRDEGFVTILLTRYPETAKEAMNWLYEIAWRMKFIPKKDGSYLAVFV